MYNIVRFLISGHFFFFTWMVLLSGHWSCTSIPMLMSFMYTEYFLSLFTVRLLKLQYEILVRKRKGGKKLSAIDYNASVCSPLSSRCQPVMERSPVKTWDLRTMEVVLHFMVFMWNNRDFVSVWRGFSLDSVYRSRYNFFIVIKIP